jgi:four helix bundle suffix protein
LRLDFEDFLRQRGLPVWPREDPRRTGLIARRCSSADEVAQWVKEVRDGRNGHGESSTSYMPSILSTGSIPSTPSTYPEIAANAALVLVTVACSLLDRQIAAQSNAFEQEGGFTERLYRVRTARRKR